MAEAHAVQTAFVGTHLHGVEDDFELINVRQEVFPESSVAKPETPDRA